MTRSRGSPPRRPTGRSPRRRPLRSRRPTAPDAAPDTPPEGGDPPIAATRSRTRRRFRAGVGAGTAIGAIILAACIPAASVPTVTTPPATPSVAAPATATATLTAASYAPAPCPNPIYPGIPQLDLGAGVECGYLTVPENRAAADGHTIRLAVARVKAAAPNPKPDPLVYLAGGPGGSGLISAAPRIAAGWNSDRDVIFLDQRGTWKSDPLLSCPEIDAFLSDWVGLNSLDPATATRSATATRACHDRLTADGVDLAAYNTTQNAADIADLRTALGIDEWNLYGVSYGTDLALRTLGDHPRGIRSVVIDSVVPPQSNLLLSFWPSAASGLNAVFDACAADPRCHGAYPSLREDFFRLADELTTTPRTLSARDPATDEPTTVVIDGYKLVNYAVTASLVPGTIARVPTTVHDLAHGDGSAIATALLAARPPRV